MKNIICAIIVSYNCDEKILLNVNAIKDQVDYIVIIDNGSNGNSKKILKKAICSNIKIIYNSNNKGIAYALNQGVKYAKGKKSDWVITLDQDSIATKDLIENMLEVYYSLPNSKKKCTVSIVPVHIEQKIYNDKQIVCNDIKYEEILTDITSGNLLKLSIFDIIGNFEEKLFIDCVDNEFCLRIYKNGYKIIRVYDSILIHNLGDTKMKQILHKKAYYTNHSYVRRYYITRNRFYIWSLYKSGFPEWVKKDKESALKDIVTIILFEKDKLLKLKMMVKGYIDFKKKHFGELKL